MTYLIGICGSGSLTIDQNKIYKKAIEIGKKIAKKNGTIICGGKGGVMEAVCKGAKQENGTTIGILPYGKEDANEFVDIPISTQLGEKRNSIIVQSSDCIIAISGRWGTLNEITLGMIHQKPIVFLKDTDGFVDIFIKSDFIKKIDTPYHITSSVDDAVDEAFKFSKFYQSKN